MQLSTSSPKRVRWQSGTPADLFPKILSPGVADIEESSCLLAEDDGQKHQTIGGITAAASTMTNGSFEILSEQCEVPAGMDVVCLPTLLDPSKESIAQQVQRQITEKSSADCRDFWLSMSVEVIDRDDAKESLKINVYTKIFMHCPDFWDEVQKGKRKLKMNGVEVTKDITQSIGKDNVEKATEVWVRNLVKGKRVSGLEIEGADSSSFPVNPNNIILNSIGKQEEIVKPWLQYQNGVVSTQYAFTTDLKLSLRVTRFPYDRHLIPIKLGVRRWKVEGQDRTWKLARTIPDWLIPETHLPWGEDKSIISLKNPPVDDQLGWSTKQKPFPYFPECPEGEKHQEPVRPVLYICAERNPFYFLATIMLPTFIVVLLAQASLFVKGDGGDSDQDTRFNTSMISLLTVAAYKSSIQSSLPTKNYMTLADWYFLAVFIFHALFVAKIIAVVHIYDSKQAGLFVRGNQNGEETTGMKETSGLDYTDDLSTWALIYLWIGFHSFFLLDYFLDFYMGQCVGLRKSWAKLLDGHVQRDSADPFIYGVSEAPKHQPGCRERLYFGLCSLISTCCCNCRRSGCCGSKKASE